jgi:hypothetical protein
MKENLHRLHLHCVSITIFGAKKRWQTLAELNLISKKVEKEEKIKVF